MINHKQLHKWTGGSGADGTLLCPSTHTHIHSHIHTYTQTFIHPFIHNVGG